MSHAPSAALERRHSTIRQRSRRARSRRARRHVAAEHPLPDQLHRQLGDRRRSPPIGSTSSPTSATSTTIDRRARHGARVPGPRARHGRRLVRRDARRRCSRRAAGGASASRRRTSRWPARLAEGDARRVRRRPRRWSPPSASSSARASARTRTRSRRCARRRGGCPRWRPTVLDAGPARRRPSATSRWPSTGGSGKPGSSARRLIRSWPAGRTPRCRTRVRASEQLTEGDLVVLDFGGVYDSYCVDLTRTVSVGPASGAGARGLRRRPRGARPRHRGRGARAIALRHRRRGAARRSRATAWARRSATARGTASASKCTRIRGSRGGGRTWTPTTKRWRPA